MAAAKNSSLTLADDCCARCGPYWPHVAGIVLLSSQPVQPSSEC